MTKSSFTRLLCFTAILGAGSLGRAQTLYIPQIADGGGWTTTFVITNTNSATTAAVPLSMAFYNQNNTIAPGATQAWSNLAFLEGSIPTSIAGASTIYLHTLGLSPLTGVGWASVNTGPGVSVYAIYTQHVFGQSQDVTAAATPAASRYIIPFDETSKSHVGIALANTGNTAQTVNVAVRANGTVIQGSFSVPPLGHYSFSFDDPSSPIGSVIANAVNGASGQAEFYTSSATLSMLSLRFNNTLLFTSAPIYSEAGPPVIGTAAGSTAPAFSSLFVSGTWTVGGTGGQIIFDVIPVGDGTYKAAVVEQSPLLLVTFTGGTLQGSTLTFNSVASGGFYGTTAVGTGSSLTLNVNNFYQVGSTVTGSLTINSTTTGNVTGSATYLP
jgi:hypothetical protein